MSQYKVIAGAVPMVHDRKIVNQGEILDDSFFKDGEIGELVKGKFIELVKGKVAEHDATEDTQSQETTKKK